MPRLQPAIEARITMSSQAPSRQLTRRQLLGTAAAAAGAVGAGALAYGGERWQMGAPFAEADRRSPTTPSALPSANVPLLLLSNPRAQPDFGPYLAEILRAEGFTAFRSAPLSALRPDGLAAFSLILLAAGPVSADEAALLRAYVAAGGALLALRPDPALAPIFGVRQIGPGSTGGHLRVVPGTPFTLGSEEGSLQFHGPSDQLALAGAEAIAHDAAGNPLIATYRFGQGRSAIWAFDLPRSIALTRQGNPAWVGEERDDLPGLRAADLFVGWIDLERIGVPQADEQQRLLLNMLQQLSETGPPLPRLWYFPGAAPAVLVATGDAHGSRARHVEQVLGQVERYGGSMSIYYTPPAAGVLGRMARKARWTASELPAVGGLLGSADPLPTPAHLATWRERGHEFGMHPYVEQGLEQGYNMYWNEFLKYGYGPLPPTVRTHRILWGGWVENARVQARYGLRMNLDHYHIGAAVRRPDGSSTWGYLSGSGLPMRFVGEDGALLGVYQQPTHLVDEHMLNVFDSGHDLGLDGAQAAAITTAQIAECVRRYPAALGLQCHIDPFLLGGAKAEQVGRWLDTTLAFAAASGVPALSAERWLAFTEARAAAQVERLRWDSARRTLAVELLLPADAPAGLTLLLPLAHAGATLREIRSAGQPIAWREQRLAGRSNAAAALTPGRQTIEAEYGT